MPARPTQPAAPATSASQTLHNWITDPDWPDKPRTWLPNIPPHIRQTLHQLVNQTQTPILLIHINLPANTTTVTKLSPPDSPSPSPSPGSSSLSPFSPTTTNP